MRGEHQPGMKKGDFPGKAAFFCAICAESSCLCMYKSPAIGSRSVYLFLSLAAPDSLGIRFPESPVCHDSRISG